MNSHWDTIINWIKRNFTLNFFVAVITFISAWFGYDQYKRNNSGKVVAVIHSNYILSSNHKNFLLVTTNDSIKIPFPQICPFYLNNSDFPIENINVNYEISSPIPIKNAPIVELNDGFTFRESSFDASLGFDSRLDYNKSILFPNESTPQPFKSISISPNELKDSLFTYFDIFSYIVYNGKKSETFNSRINIIKLSDLQNADIQKVDSTKPFEPFYKWQSSTASFLHGKISETTDILLAYHTYIDSTSTKGYFDYFKSIAPSDVDSIIPIPISPSFLRLHSYMFKEPTSSLKHISWGDTIFAILLLAGSILFIIISFKSIKVWKLFIRLFSIAVLLFGLSYLLFDSVFLYFNFSNLTISLVISLLGTISSIYPFYLGIRYGIRQPHKNILDWIFIASLLTMFIAINYLFIAEFKYDINILSCGTAAGLL